MKMQVPSIALWLLLALGCACRPSFGQEETTKRAEPAAPSAQPKFYRLEFVVKEVENEKTINSRSYATSILANTREQASIRAGTRVPHITSRSNPGSGNAALVSTQYQFYEVGVSIDSRDARELGIGQLALHINVDISGIIVAKEANSELPPAVRTTKWGSPVIVPVKRPTLVYSADDPSGNRKMQLELTATPIT